MDIHDRLRCRRPFLSAGTHRNGARFRMMSEKSIIFRTPYFPVASSASRVPVRRQRPGSDRVGARHGTAGRARVGAGGGGPGCAGPGRRDPGTPIAALVHARGRSRPILCLARRPRVPRPLRDGPTSRCGRAVTILTSASRPISRSVGSADLTGFFGRRLRVPTGAARS